MSTPVLVVVPSYTLQQTLVREFIVNEYGDGYKQIMSSEVAASRADGAGGQASYKGLNRFVIGYSKSRYGGVANTLWTFFRTRLDNNNEAFYFYNPPELLIPDPTGANATGRYLVTLEDPNEVLNRELFIQCVYSMSGIALIETRV